MSDPTLSDNYFKNKMDHPKTELGNRQKSGPAKSKYLRLSYKTKTSVIQAE